MAEVNPYRLSYIQTPDHSQQLYEQMLQPQHAIQQRTENQFRARQLDREASRDRNTDERDRISQEQRAREILMSDKRAGQREDLYSKQEDRRQADAMFNRKKMLQQEHEALIRELYEAINAPGQDALTRQNRIAAAQDALQRAGYGIAVNEDTPAGPTLPPAIPEPAPPPTAAPPKQHLSAADTTATSAALDKAGASITSKLAGGKKTVMPKTKAPPNEDASLSGQLDVADQTYSQGLGVAPWLPGQSPVGRSRAQPQSVIESNAGMLVSPDDPYNNLVK
jgi:hypothetical protein